MQEIKSNSAQSCQTETASTFSFSRRSFISTIMAAVTLPDNLNQTLSAALNDQSTDNLPWITNPEVRAALEELNKFNKVSLEHVDMIFPNSLGQYVMGSFNPKVRHLCEGRELFSSPFWSLLKERNTSNIEEAVKIANTVAKKELDIEPRRRELINRVVELTGESPSMLNIEPELRTLIKTTLNEGGAQIIPMEEFWRYSQDAFATLREYRRHYIQGSLNDFFEKHSGRLEWKPSNKTFLQGKDYISSPKEANNLQKHFERLLELPRIHIESSRDKCQAYYIKIYGEAIGTKYLHSLVKELYFNLEHPNSAFQISKIILPIKGQPCAYDIGKYEAAFFLYEPPVELAKLVEGKKAAKGL